MRRESKYLGERVIGADGVSKQGFTFYHRTGGRNPASCEKTIDSILKTGFKPGSGDMYGVGMYGTTDRKSSFNPANISSYGLGLIKFLVPVQGVLIFDYNISALLFGTGLGKSGMPAYSLEDQLVRYGIFQANKVPEIFQVLSVDLESSFGGGNRTISADRAYQIFVQGIMKGGNIPQLAKGLKSIDKDMVDAYIHAAWTANKYKNFDKFRGVNGIVFSGNHDGNVIVMYKLPKVKPLMWGISDPGDPGNPSKWIVPMHPCDGVKSAADIATVIVDMAAEKKCISKRGAVDTLYVEGMNLNNVDKITDSLPQIAPWLKNSLNGFTALECAVPMSPSKPSVIFRGQWLQGNFSGYFGGDRVCIGEAEKIIGKPLDNQSYMPEWHRGTFLGGYFAGNLYGGVFQEGQFEGIFNGGLWKYSPKAVWGKNAQFVSSPNHFIEYEGKVYPLDCEPEAWVQRKLALQATPGGTKNFVDPTKPLAENLEDSLPYRAKIVVSNSYGPSGSVADKFKYIREHYDWLWKKIKFGNIPTIAFSDNNGCVLEEGSLTVGTVCFDYYTNKVCINGGVVKGNNLFEGEFRAGIYTEGQFMGKWFGGTWDAAKCKWSNGVAEFIPGATIGTSKVIAQTTILLNGKATLMDQGAYLVWKDIPALIDALKSGEYRDLMAAAKKSGKNLAKTAGTLAKKYKNTAFTAQQLTAIIGDDDDSDDDLAVYNLGKQQASVDLDFNTVFNEFLYGPNSKMSLEEQEFYYGNLSPEEQDRLFDEFKDTYEKATGAAFSRSAFDWRADNWTFMGDAPNDNNPNAPVGGIAVRKQMSNDMYKLVASFGPFRSVMKGFMELCSKHGNSSIWGIVTPEIKKMLVRGNKEFVGLPGPVVKAMEPAIKKFSNGEVKSVGLNGEMKVDTPAGIMTKVFVCNKNYIRWLINSVEDPALQSKLPVPQAVVKPLLHLVKALI